VTLPAIDDPRKEELLEDTLPPPLPIPQEPLTTAQVTLLRRASRRGTAAEKDMAALAPSIAMTAAAAAPAELPVPASAPPEA